MNAASSTANTANSPITLPFDQGYFVPAQDSATKSAVRDGMNKQLETRSSSLIFWVNVRLSSWRVLGSEKRKTMLANETAPIGRLILRRGQYQARYLENAHDEKRITRNTISTPKTALTHPLR